MAMGIPVGLLYTIGIVLAIASGAVTALSMVAQRGVLNHPQQVIPLGACGVRCGRLGKNKLWVLALLLYACATGGLYSVAGLCIPLALLSCLFVTLLVWNLYFSRYFLGEVLTRAKVGGSLVVVAGSCLCAVGASVGRESRAIELTSDDVARLYADPGGAAWFGALVLATLATLGAIIAYERRYPLDSEGRLKGTTKPPPVWLDDYREFEGWRILFILGGCLAVLVGIQIGRMNCACVPDALSGRSSRLSRLGFRSGAAATRTRGGETPREHTPRQYAGSGIAESSRSKSNILGASAPAPAGDLVVHVCVLV